jgi:aerobic-type carbon monoxide dehydrogenase small subunit (CoxS/CutS family)
MAFNLRVNGSNHTVDVDGETPLLRVLRKTTLSILAEVVQVARAKQ